MIIGLVEWVIGYSILLFWLPESPKWLYDKKRYVECQKVLLYMNKVNKGSDDETSTPEINRLSSFEMEGANSNSFNN